MQLKNQNQIETGKGLLTCMKAKGVQYFTLTDLLSQIKIKSYPYFHMYPENWKILETVNTIVSIEVFHLGIWLRLTDLEIHNLTRD